MNQWQNEQSEAATIDPGGQLTDFENSQKVVTSLKIIQVKRIHNPELSLEKVPSGNFQILWGC